MNAHTPRREPDNGKRFEIRWLDAAAAVHVMGWATTRKMAGKMAVAFYGSARYAHGVGVVDRDDGFRVLLSLRRDGQLDDAWVKNPPKSAA